MLAGAPYTTDGINSHSYDDTNVLLNRLQTALQTFTYQPVQSATKATYPYLSFRILSQATYVIERNQHLAIREALAYPQTTSGSGIQQTVCQQQLTYFISLCTMLLLILQVHDGDTAAVSTHIQELMVSNHIIYIVAVQWNNVVSAEYSMSFCSEQQLAFVLKCAVDHALVLVERFQFLSADEDTLLLQFNQGTHLACFTLVAAYVHEMERLRSQVDAIDTTVVSREPQQSLTIQVSGVNHVGHNALQRPFKFVLLKVIP